MKDKIIGWAILIGLIIIGFGIAWWMAVFIFKSAFWLIGLVMGA
jgi:hypothetical protein